MWVASRNKGAKGIWVLASVEARRQAFGGASARFFQAFEIKPQLRKIGGVDAGSVGKEGFQLSDSLLER